VKRVLVVTACLAALGGAAAGGAIAVGAATDVRDGQWARLGSTRIYCQAFYEKQYKAHAFDCAVWNGSVRARSSYSAVIDELGVEVDRWDSSGRKYRKVTTYVNP
jgi:hypothetical protein